MAEFREHEIADEHRSQSEGGDRRADHHPHQRLAATLGNAGVGQVLASGVQRSGATSAQQLDESVARSIEDRRGRGSPLDEATRTDMEGALGQDLSDVRVHTDSTANELSSAVGARAFTTGSDLFFKPGTYDPSSSSGRELLAHELTHVVQQREGTSGLDAGEVSHPSDSAEQDAAAVGKAVAGNGSPAGAETSPTAASRAPGVAREAEQEGELEEPLAGAWEPGAVQREEEEESEDQIS